MRTTAPNWLRTCSGGVASRSEACSCLRKRPPTLSSRAKIPTGLSHAASSSATKHWTGYVASWRQTVAVNGTASSTSWTTTTRTARSCSAKCPRSSGTRSASGPSGSWVV
uniref:(northern house mosquito) hypothetical protein n=1 Tax=Culex pipiens TaxID=7175 RepID=A0A8D8D926_CULPI